MTNINNGVLDGLRRLAAKVRGVDIDGGAPGAPLGYRLRGATGAGYPQSGTWKTRDVVPDGAGNIWVNTGKGEPGTWAQAGFGRRAKLQGWYAGLANRPYNSVAVLCLGDSVTEGANATAWSRAFPPMLQAALNSRFPTPGLATHGRGFLTPLLAGTTSFTLPYITLTGPSGGPAIKRGFGINGRGYDISTGLAGSTGTQTAPPAFSGISGSAFTPAAGTYTVAWSVQLGAGATSNDANNCKLIFNTTTLATSVNAGAPGTYQQTPATFTADGVNNLYIGTAGNAGTGGVVYTVTIEPGCSFTYSLNGDNAVILYANQSGGGSFKYNVDGGGYTTVSTSGTAADGQFAGPISLGSAGAHTLVIKYVSGGTTIVEGVSELNGDAAAGIQVYNGGAFGSASGDWAGWYTTATSGLTTPGTQIGSTGVSLIIIELGANDFNNGTSPAALYSNLKTLIATIRAAFTAVNFTPAPPILLLSLPQQNDGNSWSPYLAALYSLAAGDPMTDVLDLALRMPSATAAQQWGLVSSGEFSDAGMSMIADAICEFLSPQ